MTSRFRAPRFAAPLVLSALGCALTYRAQAQDHEDTDEIIVTGVPRDRAAGELPQSVTVVASDGGPLRLTGADEPHAALVTVPGDALLPMLQGAATRATVAGDRRAVDVLHGWFDRARGVAAG